jgi:hypothetical protein
MSEQPTTTGPYRVYYCEREEGDWLVFNTYADFDLACDTAESLVRDGNAEAKVRDVPTNATVHHVTN